MAVYFQKESPPWWAQLLAGVGGELLGGAIKNWQSNEANRKNNAFLSELISGGAATQPQDMIQQQQQAPLLNFNMQPSGQYNLNGVVPRPEQPTFLQNLTQPAAAANNPANSRNDFINRALALAGTKRFSMLPQENIMSAIQLLSGMYDDRARNEAINAFDVSDPRSAMQFALRYGGQQTPQISNWITHFNPNSNPLDMLKFNEGVRQFDVTQDMANRHWLEDFGLKQADYELRKADIENKINTPKQQYSGAPFVDAQGKAWQRNQYTGEWELIPGMDGVPKTPPLDKKTQDRIDVIKSKLQGKQRELAVAYSHEKPALQAEIDALYKEWGDITQGNEQGGQQPQANNIEARISKMMQETGKSREEVIKFLESKGVSNGI